MTVDALLRDLTSRDVVLSVDGERLLFDAPARALTPELRAAICDHRNELIQRLKVQHASTAEASAKPPRIDFTRWVCRQSADGTIGWENPDLADESRWWARSPWNVSPTRNLA